MARRITLVLKVACLVLVGGIALEAYQRATEEDPLLGLSAELSALSISPAAVSPAAAGGQSGSAAGEAGALPAGAPPKKAGEQAEAPPGSTGKEPPPAAQEKGAASKEAPPAPGDGRKRGEGAKPGGSKGEKPPAEAAAPGPIPEQYKAIDKSAIFGLSAPPPPPPALLGLIGRYAILQAPDGKVDLVPEGGELSGIKLVRMGINRVLIEYQGKSQELTLFSGLGSLPLLPGEKEGRP